MADLIIPEYRNPARNRHGTIDCEIEHPKLGWIPFTCDPDDAEPPIDSATLYDRIEAAGGIADYVAPPVPLQTLSRPAFLFMMSKIGVSKQDVYALINAMPEETTEQQDAKTLARLVFDETQFFKRDNALLNTLATAKGLTEEQVDAAWRQGQALKW